MNNFAGSMMLDCDAMIVCRGCRDEEHACGGSEREAVNALDQIVAHEGWQMVDGYPYCRECARRCR